MNKKRKNMWNVVAVMLIAILFLGCHTEAHASGWAQVTAVLTADQKTVSSGYAMFDAKEMYCCTQAASEYPIKFQAYGKGDTDTTPYLEAKATYNVGQSGTESITNRGNYHQITLTGWNINSAVKNCIGHGWITD